MSRQLLIGMAATLLLSGCTSNRCGTPRNVAQQSFIHEYGVPVTQKDWIARGSNGDVITTRLDGVTVTAHYKGNQLHGRVTYSFPHSQIIERTEVYDLGLLIAETDHFSSGVPHEERFYRGPNDVELVVWYEDGTPRSREHLLSDRLVTGEYFTPMNEVETRVRDGEGIRVRRGAEGELLSHDKIAQGELVERVIFDGLGHPREIIPYCEGKIHGLRRTFLTGGEPQTTEQWVMGVQHGLTTLYRNGELYAQVPYENGMRHGVERRFRNGQEVCEEVRWRFDERYQDSKFYLHNDLESPIR